MNRSRVVTLVLSVALGMSAAAVLDPPSALAQGAARAPKKKAPEAPPPPPPAPAPAPEPPPPPPVLAEPAVAPAPVAAPPVDAAAQAGSADSTDVTEDPTKRYYFIGLRYRGTYFPSFILGSFVREAQSFYFNTFGIEADIRKDGFSFIPAISYTEYGTGDVLFADKTRDLKFAGNWGLANSTMKGLYLTMDFMWSAPITKSWQFEYGMGAGVGFMFGGLVTNWVTDDPNGPLVNSENRRFRQCNSVQDGTGCRVQDHENATTARVGRYEEPSWFNGGAKPSVLPYLSIPQVGIRFKPIKQFQARLGFGLSITGFWFGLSANYGLEQPKSN